MHCDWSSRVLYNSTRHTAYVWCVPYNSTYARKPSQSFLSLKILRRFFQTAIMAEEFPSFDLGCDFLNDQNNEEAGKSLKKFTSAYLFQIAREKSCDYLFIIYMKKFEMVKQKKRMGITQSGKNCTIIAPSRAGAHFCCLTNSCPFVVVFIL